MNGDPAATERNQHPDHERSEAPMSDWMRWNDIASTPARLRPSLDLSDRFVTAEIETSEPAG